MNEPLTSDDLLARVKAYLSGGGLFNPELANHQLVRDLIIEARDEIEILASRLDTARDQISMLKSRLAAANDEISELEDALDECDC